MRIVFVGAHEAVPHVEHMHGSREDLPAPRRHAALPSRRAGPGRPGGGERARACARRELGVQRLTDVLRVCAPDPLEATRAQLHWLLEHGPPLTRR